MKFDGYICDICGALMYNKDNRLEIKKTETDGKITVSNCSVDVCGKCASKMEKWIKENKPYGDIRDRVVGSENDD